MNIMTNLSKKEKLQRLNEMPEEEMTLRFVVNQQSTSGGQEVTKRERKTKFENKKRLCVKNDILCSFRCY